MNRTQAFKTILQDIDFVFVDLGGRHGLMEPWSEVKSIITTVSFEPDITSSHLRTNLNEGTHRAINLQSAVGSRKEKRNFYYLRNRSYCSLLKPNETELEGTYYYDRNFYKIDEVHSINVDTIENQLTNVGLKYIDFMKIDIQGAEMMVFENMDSLWNNLLGVYSEAYSAELYKDGADISKILGLLYSKEFELFDLKTIAYSTITSSNSQQIYAPNNLASRPFSGYKPRPMVFDILSLRNRKFVLASADSGKIRKSLFLDCLYGYFDRALDILIKSDELTIFDSHETQSLKSAILYLHKSSLSRYQRFKEMVKSRFYSLPIR